MPRSASLFVLLSLLTIPCLLTAGEEREVSPDLLLGTWRVQASETMCTHLEVFEREGRYCARIVYLSDPCYPLDDERGMAGLPRVDRNNSNAELRDRPMLGLEAMHSMYYDKRGCWKGGKAYSPMRGKEANCKLELIDENTLDCYVYVKIGFLKKGKNITWTRVVEAEDDGGRLASLQSWTGVGPGLDMAGAFTVGAHAAARWE